jgi:predicted 3-demethylubiquinone-9 3-methyltransferase (glyoxalase superfamily)
METKQKITPHLWYDKEAKEAAQLYTSTFRQAQIKNTTTIPDTPSGDTDLITIELWGQEFMLINAGPYFKFNPTISFLVTCDTRDEVESLWQKLSPGGRVLMALGDYPFSEKYGWTEDKYGLSWQIMFAGDRKFNQRFIPTLMFTGKVCGKSEEAIYFYVSVFHNAKVGDILRYTKNEEPDREGTIKHASFTLEGMEFAAMDSAYMYGIAFNEAISFIVHCDTQEEIDYYWHKLTADPAAEQCGWLKDRYGVSWQIVPSIMNEMMGSNDQEKIARVTAAFLKMKKFDIEKLKQAYKG